VMLPRFGAHRDSLIPPRHLDDALAATTAADQPVPATR